MNPLVELYAQQANRFSKGESAARGEGDVGKVTRADKGADASQAVDDVSSPARGAAKLMARRKAAKSGS